MSFARRALYFPNGSSLYSRVKKGFWLKRESQPGAIVAHGSSIFHPHRAPPLDFQGEPETGFSIEYRILFFQFMHIPLYEVG